MKLIDFRGLEFHYRSPLLSRLSESSHRNDEVAQPPKSLQV